jgi:hypothetical protein
MSSQKLQKSEMQSFFREKLPKTIDDSSDFPMLLMVLGEKQAALTMNASDEQISALEEFCDEFGFHLKVLEGRTSKPSKAGAENPSFDQKGAFVATTEKRFEILEDSEGRFYGCSDKAVGEFLGFPESSIRFFNSCEQPGLKSRQKINELMENGEVKEKDLKYLNLTTFIPAPEIEAVRDAIELGKRREKRLEKFDSENSVGIGEGYLKRRFQNSFY